jgi:hypothetical protein
MVATALVALELAAIRAVSDHSRPDTYLLAMGALPMANVLAFGLLVGCRYRGSRSFLVGFEALGALALAFYVKAIVSPFDGRSLSQIVVAGYLWLAWDLLPTGVARTVPRMLIAYVALSLWLTWPQLAFALAGGLFTRFPSPLRERLSPGGRRGGHGKGPLERIG